MLEALIVGLVVVFATMAVARHVGHEVAPGDGGCADCSEKCGSHDSCPIALVKERYSQRGAPRGRKPDAEL